MKISTLMNTTSFVETADTLWNDGHSVIAVKVGKDGQLSFPRGWQKFCDNPPTQADQAQFRQQLHGGYNALFLATGRVLNGQRLVCIDVDDDRLVRLVEAVFGKTSCGRYGSKGIGVFALTDPTDELFKKKSQIKLHNGELGIELLSRNAGTFIPPSTHRKTGNTYKWIGSDLVNGLEALPTLTRDQWSLLKTVVESPDTITLLNGDETHDPMVRVCAKIVRFAEDDDYLAQVVQSVFSPSYDGENNSDYEVGRALKSAREKGYDQNKGGGVPEETLRRLEEFNDIYCVVSMDGKTLVLEKGYNPELKRFMYSFWRPIDFKQFHLDDLVTVRSDTDQLARKGIGEVWFNWTQRSKATGLFLMPDRPPGLITVENRKVFNVWTGFSVEPEPGDWSQLQFHLKEVICGGDERYFDYLIGWLANAVQYPHKQGEVAVVLRGGRGTGKGTFGKMLAQIFGQHFFHTASQNQVAGRFNAHLRDTVLLFADEAFFAGDKKHESVLKALITEDYLAIEGKFVNVVQTRNRLHIVMATNEEWAVPAGVDERRFFVLEVSELHKQDKSYFDKLHKRIYGDALPAMLQHLLDYDLSSFQLRDVPQTKALANQKTYSLPPVEDWLLLRLQEGSQLELGEWDEWVETQKLFDDFVTYTKKKNQRPTADNAFSQRVQKVLGARPVRRTGAFGFRVRALEFAQLEECRARFDAYVGFSTDWPEEETEPSPPKF